MIKNRRDSFAALVETMRNRQRYAWGRAGWPGMRERDVNRLLPFTSAGLRQLIGKSLPSDREWFDRGRPVPDHGSGP